MSWQSLDPRVRGDERRNSGPGSSQTRSLDRNISPSHQGIPIMLFLLLGILVTLVVGAICFYLIDRFVRDRRLGNLLKLLVALLVIISILQRLLPALGLGWM